MECINQYIGLRIANKINSYYLLLNTANMFTYIISVFPATKLKIEIYNTQSGKITRTACKSNTKYITKKERSTGYNKKVIGVPPTKKLNPKKPLHPIFPIKRTGLRICTNVVCIYPLIHLER